MIKTIDLIAKEFENEDKQIEELKQADLSQKELEKKIKALHKETKRKVKQIEKTYPLEKEVNKFLKEE